MPLSRSVGIRRVAAPAALSAALLLTAAACSSTSGGGSSTSGSTATAGGASPAAAACANMPAGPINVYNIIPLTGPTATSGQLIESIAVVGRRDELAAALAARADGVADVISLEATSGADARPERRNTARMRSTHSGAIGVAMKTVTVMTDPPSTHSDQ